MDFANDVGVYGYLAIALAVFFGGNAIVFIAGIIAHHGTMPLPYVLTAAICGIFIGSQSMFYCGRFINRRFRSILERPAVVSKTAKINQYLKKSPFFAIIMFHLLPGFRIVAPIILGVLRYRRSKFVIYDFIAAALVTTFFIFSGFGFSHVIESFFERKKFVDFWIAAVIIILVITFIIIKKKRNKQNP
jgi:membrane protein DedA with SNARE-associated domain